MATRETWDAQFGTGLRSEYDFTIYMASFGTDLSYMNGQQYLLILAGVDEDNTDSTEMLSLGEGWESRDGGFTIAHERKAIVNKNSVYGKWCASAASAMELAKSDYLWDKNPLDASTWANTRWHMEERVVGDAFVGRDGSQVPERTRLMPVEFLGFASDPSVVPEAPKSTPKASASQKRAELLAKASAPTQVSESAPIVEVSTNGVSDPHGLIALAQSNDFSAFIDLALAIEEVVLDPILSESIIDSGPDGFYALHSNPT